MQMGKFPKKGLRGRAVHFVRSVAELKVPLYAANACFFMVLAVFPTLLLLLGLLRYTPLEVQRLGQLLSGVLPEAFLEGAEKLIRMTYDGISGTALSVTAVTALWSASRGIFGIMTGLNAIYGVVEDRGYLRTRCISMAYMVLFLAVLLLTLLLHVFGSGLLNLLNRLQIPLLNALSGIVDFRFFLLLAVQTAFFTAMFMVLPNEKNRFRDSVPGALLASSGWLIFSDLYSVYVEQFARLSNIYGSVYAVALAMLWLYCCMSIVFYGGALNRYLMEHEVWKKC